MPVSAGFQRKIEDWIIGEDWSVTFCPFLAQDNPYKARVMIVGASVQPKVDDDTYIEALLNAQIYSEFYDFATHSRENKGALRFMEDISLFAPTVLSSLNTLMVDSSKELAEQKGTTDYRKGQQVFSEVLEEFQPEVVVLHGAETVKQFRQQFATQLIDNYSHIKKVQDLENVGVFATLQLNTKQLNIVACRSLSQYGNGETFAPFRKKIAELLR